MSVTPYQIDIPDDELELLRRKLELARIPTTLVEWREDNGTDSDSIHKLVDFWLKEYDWRAQEAELNRLPQFTTSIEANDGFGTLEIHFVHSLSSKPDAVPLLFLHGWPGSFLEVTKGLSQLNEAGFHVVAPSLPGYGFSSFPRKQGFDVRQYAHVMQKLMLRLGYDKFVVQGGDWGSQITRSLGLLYPENVMALHLNMLDLPKLTWPEGTEPTYTASEQARLDRFFTWFQETNSSYSTIQRDKPITLGFAMHDSPVGLLAWMLDKLTLWSDAYPWSPTELITWTLLHYFPGPTTGFYMYHENHPEASTDEGGWMQQYTHVPCGLSAFPKELACLPQSWAERVMNVKFYREHDKGGHFAMYEVPEVLVKDVVEFFRSIL